MSNIHSTKVLDVSQTGTFTAQGQTIQIAFEGHNTGSVVISGIWTGTIILETSGDGGTTWGQAYFGQVTIDPMLDGIPSLTDTVTTNGSYKIFNTTGITHARLRTTTATAWTGTASIYMSAVAAGTNFTFTKSQIIQNVISDPLNSSTAVILAGNTFQGGTTSTLGTASIQVSLKTDKNCTVYVDQSSDGDPLHWDIIDTYNYYYAKGGQSWTTQAVASYYRVRVTNNSLTDTSYVRLQTTLCPIVEAIPRSLSPEGNLKVGVYEIEDDQGNKVGISPMSELRTSEHIRLVGVSFGTTFDTNFWTKTTLVGGDATTLSNNTLIMATDGATANASIIIQSTRRGRYIPSYPNYYRGQIIVPAVSGANIRRWGAFETTDGFFFETDGTNLAVTCRKGSSDVNKVYSGSFNGSWGSDYTLNTNNHTYEIIFTNSSASFFIDGVLLHKFTAATATLTGTLHLLVGLQCTNTASNTAVNTLQVRSSTINRIGKETTSPAWKNQHGAIGATVLKYGNGMLHRVTINAYAGASTIILYDALTATNPIASIAFGGNVQLPMTLTYELNFYTGLTYVTTNGATDITIVYE